MAVIPVVVGTFSFLLPVEESMARPDNASHRWHILVRHGNSCDLSPFIQKCIFHLHPSFPNPIQECHQAPFLLTQFGWGEFQFTAEIHFHPCYNIQPLLIQQNLILNMPLTEEQLTPCPTNSFAGPCCTNEPFKDNPSLFFQKLHELFVASPMPLLVQNIQNPRPEIPHPLQLFYKFNGISSELQALDQAHQKVNDEINSLKKKIQEMDALIASQQASLPLSFESATPTSNTPTADI